METIEEETSLGRKTWECQYCHKKGHLKKKNKGKDNAKSKGDGHGRQSSCLSSSLEIEEINATFDEPSLLVLDDVTTHVGVNMVFSPSHTWLLDSSASFHVTPHREWFTCHEAKALAKVSL